MKAGGAKKKAKPVLVKKRRVPAADRQAIGFVDRQKNVILERPSEKKKLAGVAPKLGGAGQTARR